MPDFQILNLIAGFVIALALAIISWRLKALTPSGAVGMTVVGTAVFGIGGFTAATPIVFFFISASLLSRIKTTAKTRALDAVGKSGARDFRQVFANGGIGALCLLVGLVSADQVWFYAYLATICEASADTWATEIGTLSRRRPVSVRSFKPVEIGQSGGISLVGTLAAVVGATSTGAFGYAAIAIFPVNITIAPSTFLVIVTTAVVGSLVDSVLGATVQAQYRCSSTGRLTEKILSGGQPNPLVWGYRWVDNDLVNTLGTLSSALAALAILD